MLHVLRRHPIPMRARFDHCLVVTWAFPEAVLRPLLPPGLELDTLRGNGFVAAAMVQTRGMRPVWAPAALGRDFFLAGYRCSRGTGPRVARCGACGSCGAMRTGGGWWSAGTC